VETNAMISIITPTTRPEMLPIIQKCLRRQDFEDWEWIIVSPKDINTVKPTLLLKDPPKEKGDFWTLCKGWNTAYAHAKGDLIVNIQDGIWFPPDVLSKFWFHYQNQPRILVSAIGHQYDEFDDLGMPTNKIWHDPRSKTGITFEEVPPSEMEMVMCSIPKTAILECGGIDEEYDTCNGAQEKEMCWRLNKMNWDFYIDHTIEYRAIHHPRLTENWDDVYKNKTTPLFVRHMTELTAGTRTLDVNNILKYVEN
jgi:glycosyltransferase involved in cell wall biosynthesis